MPTLYCYNIIIKRILIDLCIYILTDPLLFDSVNFSTGICHVSVMWSSSRNETCGPVNYEVQFIHNDHVLRNLFIPTSEISIISRTPNTSYTIAIAAMDSAGKGMHVEDMFSTGVPGMCELSCTLHL